MAKDNFFGKYRKWLPVIIVVGIAVCILCAIAIPYIFIWALNTLFGLNIQFNFWTWLAAVIILIIIAPKGGGMWRSRRRG